MNRLHRLFRLHRLMKPDDGSGGGGVGGSAMPDAAAGAGGAVVPDQAAPTEAPLTGDAAAVAAMFPKEAPADPAAAAGQPCDEAGRFAAKVAAEAAAAAAPGAKPATPAVPGVTPPKPAALPDDLKMPDGLTVPAQQRFQTLANEVKELRPLREKVETQDRTLSYFQETFQQNAIKQEQFEQAADVIGMINRGDFASARSVLMEQLQMLSLLAGDSGAAVVDPLANYPDLRAAVEGLQVSEKHALEMARNRMQQGVAQQQTARQQQAQQAQQQSQQVLDGAIKAVDAFANRMKASDLDYDEIERILEPRMQRMMQQFPPQQWAALIEHEYQLIKDAGGRFRQAAPLAPANNTLRPAGASSARAAPQNGFEAMWNKARPAGA